MLRQKDWKENVRKKKKKKEDERMEEKFSARDINNKDNWSFKMVFSRRNRQSRGLKLKGLRSTSWKRSGTLGGFLFYAVWVFFRAYTPQTAEIDTKRGMYNLEDIVTFSVGGKGAGKRQGCAVFAPTLIPFAGRTIWK